MIGVVNYSMGNIRSVVKAIEYLGFEATVVTAPREFEAVDRIILPGVGAFGAAIKHLAQTGLQAALLDQVVAKRKPFLGICLGLQLLADKSHEYGTHEGLGWIGGEVTKLMVEAQGLKIPHIGWNAVEFTKDCPLFTGIKNNTDFFFVHSYQLIPTNPADLVATTNYGGLVTAAVWRDHIFGVQFHPEKSQDAGLKVLENFINYQSR